MAIKAGKYSKRLTEILNYNNFRVQGNRLIEKAFALGTGAFVEYLNADGQVIIDYIRADMICVKSQEAGTALRRLILADISFCCIMAVEREWV